MGVAATGQVMSRSSPSATTVDLDPVRNLTVSDATRRLARGYGRALGRLPSGRHVFRGLPFDLGPRTTGPRFALLDRPIAIPLPGDRAVSHIVVAHLSDAWRDDVGHRPGGLALGHVVP